MKHLRNLYYFLFTLSAVMHSNLIYAQTDVQTMVCDIWGSKAKYLFDNFEAYKQSGVVDPIARIKKSTNYEDYHIQSAGGIMLRTIISGLENNQAKKEVRDKVISQCNLFPADSVDSSNEAEPISSFK